MGLKQLLTNTRLTCFYTCQRKHYFAFELGIRRPRQGKATRMGSAFHAGLERIATGGSIEDAICGACDYLAKEGIDTNEGWGAVEATTLAHLLNGYFWRWREDGLAYKEVERSFRFPVKRSRTFAAAGKTDGIAILNDETVVVEHKLLGEDIGDDAPLWKRVAIDSQVGFYILAARRGGYKHVNKVLYDVARKPTIEACAVPVLDEEGRKCVLGTDGCRVFKADGSPRLTPDSKLGYTLATRDMTPEEWGEKLRADIGERPDFYYNRKLVERSEEQLEEHMREIVHTAKLIQQARKANVWPRRVSKDTCPWCEYFELCAGGWSGGEIPDGLEMVNNVHPELEDAGDA